MMGDAINELAGVAASDFRVDMARASAARGVLPGVRTSSSTALSVRLGVAGASAVGGCFVASLLDERLLDVFLIGFGVVGGPSVLAIFVGGALAAAVELEAEGFAANALRDFLSFSIAPMTSSASNACVFLFLLPVRMVDNLNKLAREVLFRNESFQ